MTNCNSHQLISGAGSASDDLYKQQSAVLQRETDVLRQRIDRLNRAFYSLPEENNSLKSYMKTHSTNVLAEHNYNLQLN